MLSALIPSQHSYRAMPRAGQLVHQRLVHSSPLVTYSSITRSVDYIFTLPLLKRVGVGVLPISLLGNESRRPSSSRLRYDLIIPWRNEVDSVVTGSTESDSATSHGIVSIISGPQVILS